MAEVKRKFYRLFKVAKEFNVGIDTIIDYLGEKGHVVSSSPNTKLSGDLYDILLKEFASEKQLKAKAEQFIEKRKEEVRTTTTTRVKTPGAEGEEDDVELISAEQLRKRLKPQLRARKGAKRDQPTETPEQENPPVAQPPANKAEEVLSPKDKAPKLKVVGKIDLDNIGKPTVPVSKEPEPPKEEPKTPPPVSPPVKPEVPVAKEEPVPPPVEEPKKEEVKVEASPVVEPPAQPVPPPQPEVKKPKPKPKPQEVPKAPPVAKPTPIKEEKKAPAPPKQEEVTTTVEEAPEAPPQEIIRADKNTPKLSGLKVMGKIDLDGIGGNRKKGGKGDSQKKDGNKDKQKTSQTPTENKGPAKEEEEGDNKKKRRRRRKRKRKSAVVTDVKNDNKDKDKNKSKGKKEKPSAKEVDESIRKTLSQMSQGPSRNRQRLRRAKRDAEAEKRERLQQKLAENAQILDVTEFITANEFADLIEVPVNEIIKKSFELGMMVSINQRLDAELMTLIAEEYGYKINFIDVTEQEIEILEEEDNPEDLLPRNPIITVMGHVDHGKTTLLDHLRKTNVTSQEAGGITQHIGAYEVKLKGGGQVTFLDTPGHEAFTAMRARGAKVTDLVIVVIAADDAVMPQTREAINHAQAGEVPMVFAINKIDKAGADPERIKGQLAEMNLLVEDWGGNFQSQEISALNGLNVDELLEKVMLETELLELKANPDRTATGTVIEARLDKGRGNVATMLVQNGTLQVGDEMVAGVHFGKVRALIDQNGKRIKKATPSQPVQVLGLNGQPTAGDSFHVFGEDGKAKEIAQKRHELYREQQLRQTKRITLEEIGRRRAIGNFEELNIIIRADVDGSVEALAGSLLKLSTGEVQVNILLKGTGAITEGDVLLASASDAVIIAFNVRPSANARHLAEKEEIDIRTYSVIYDAINDVRDALEGLLSPEIKEEVTGTAEVREVFKVSKVGTVAGCYATSGKIYRNDPVRVIRDGVVIYDSTLSSLKRFKDDVKEVANGFEFGATVDNYNDIKIGDVLEFYKINEIRRKL